MGKPKRSTKIKISWKSCKDEVIISIPGDYSRKPPVAEILQVYVLGPKPGRCIELSAREMNPGCLSWGNEPLHSQESQHFMTSSVHPFSAGFK